MLHLLYNLVCLLLVFFINGNSFFKPGPHGFLWLNWSLLFLFLFWLSTLLLVFFYELFGVLAYEPLIITLILLLFLLLDWGPWCLLACILLQRHLVDNLSNHRITQLSILQYLICILICLCFLLLFLLLLFSVLFLFLLLLDVSVKSLCDFSFSCCYLFRLFYLLSYVLSQLSLMLYHFREWSITFIFIFIFILLTGYFLNLFIVANCLSCRQISSHSHILQEQLGWLLIWLRRKQLGLPCCFQ